MADWIFTLAMTWHAVLFVLLAVAAIRARGMLFKVIAFDAVSIVFISALVVLAAYRQEVRFLEIALVLAMLAFTQTLAAARLLTARRLVE